MNKLEMIQLSRANLDKPRLFLTLLFVGLLIAKGFVSNYCFAEQREQAGLAKDLPTKKINPINKTIGQDQNTSDPKVNKSSAAKIKEPKNRTNDNVPSNASGMQNIAETTKIVSSVNINNSSQDLKVNEPILPSLADSDNLLPEVTEMLSESAEASGNLDPPEKPKPKSYTQEKKINKHSLESFTQELDSLLPKSGLSSKAGAILFAENEQIKVSLSNRDVNRLSVTADKIQSINGPTGFYIAKNDPLGSAYLGINTDKKFTLFISTIKGHQFSLLVVPVTSSGKSIVLIPTMLSRMTTQQEATEGYQKLIVALINSMINNEPCQDYVYVPLKRSKTHNFYKVAQIKPVGYYLGANLIGLISVIKNSTKQPLNLKPASFYTPGVRAVALSTETLDPKASGLLYQVIGK